ncbi:hypothetical protein CHS0354_014284 [Potamilus streckersoni]|uniref:Uncharacterized protein n=1 Tax=Potamilus streckersoni TaxID=2493646 RepID=A0AAE0SKJ0_9BIVA|nr:hypothetical protein CHS0354_014284 [Potamilus streckersoni]
MENVLNVSGCFGGKFSNISKEMTPANRIDLLVDGIIHYREKVMRKQGVSANDVKQWSAALKQLHVTTTTIRNGNKNQFIPSKIYAVHLKKYFQFSQALLAVVDPEVKEDMKKKISRWKSCGDQGRKTVEKNYCHIEVNAYRVQHGGGTKGTQPRDIRFSYFKT